MDTSGYLSRVPARQDVLHRDAHVRKEDCIARGPASAVKVVYHAGTKQISVMQDCVIPNTQYVTYINHHMQ